MEIVFAGAMDPNLISSLPTILTLLSLFDVAKYPLRTMSRLTAHLARMFVHLESGNFGHPGELMSDHLIHLGSIMYSSSNLSVHNKLVDSHLGWMVWDMTHGIQSRWMFLDCLELCLLLVGQSSSSELTVLTVLDRRMFADPPSSVHSTLPELLLEVFSPSKTWINDSRDLMTVSLSAPIAADNWSWTSLITFVLEI